MESIESELLVDGFVVTGRDWALLGNHTPIILPQTVVVRPVKNNWLIGIDATAGTNMWRIRFPSFCSFELSILFLKQKLVLTEGNSYVDYSKVIQCFLDAVDYALVKMRGTKTSTDFIAKYGNSYGEHIKGESVGKDCGGVLVSPEDIEKFGNHLDTYLQKEAEKFQLSTLLVLNQFGQNALVKAALRVYKSQFKIHLADQIVIHFARDYSKEKTCLFWCFDEVKKAIGRAPSSNHTYEYYPGLIGGGLGNFVFDFVGMENTGDIDVRHSKFYSDEFKGFHRRSTSPFKSPSAIQCLSSSQTVDLNTMSRWIKAIETGIEDMHYREKITARAEAIFQSIDDISWANVDDAVRHMNFEYGNNLLCALKQYPYDDFKMQMENSVKPVCNTLSTILEATITEIQTLGLSLPSVLDLNTAAVCEILLCFALYGECRYYTNTRYPAGQMKNDLRLTKTTFRNREGDVFPGLSFQTLVSVTEDGRVEYKGKLHYSTVMFGQLNMELSQSKTEVVLGTLSRLSIDLRLDEKEDFFELILEAMQFFTNKKLFANRTINQDRIFEYRTIRQFTPEPISTNEFIKLLFEDQNLQQQSIRQIMSSIKQRLTTDELEQFKDEFEIWLERTCIENFVFLYPVSPGHNVAVLPIFTKRHKTFDTLEESKKQKFAMLFGNIYLARESLPSQPAAVYTRPILDAIEENHLNISMEGIFSKIFLRELAISLGQVVTTVN